MTIVKLTLLDKRPIWVNLEHMLTATGEERGTKLVFTSGTSIVVMEQPGEINARPRTVT